MCWTHYFLVITRTMRVWPVTMEIHEYTPPHDSEDMGQLSTHLHHCNTLSKWSKQSRIPITDLIQQKTYRRRLKLKKYLRNVTNFIFSNQEERSCSSGGVFLSRHPCCLLHLERHWPVRDDPPVQQCEWGDQAVCQVSDAESQHPLHWSPRLRVVGATAQPVSGKNWHSQKSSQLESLWKIVFHWPSLFCSMLIYDCF